MKIRNNILKYYLKNCIFINGTAYAGKSIMCKMLARGPLRNLALRLCEINHYMREHIMFIITGRVPVIPVL